MPMAERERDTSGSQASGLTPEIPFHVALVPSLLVPPHSPAVVKKLFYSCRPLHCLVDVSSFVFFAAPEAYRRRCLSEGHISLNEVEQGALYSSRHNTYHVASWVHEIEEYKRNDYLLYVAALREF